MSRSAGHQRPRIRSTLLVVALLTLGALPAPAAELPADPCTPPPEVAAEVAVIEQLRSDCASDQPCWDAIVERAAALAAAHPDDVVAQRTWQIQVQRKRGGDAEAARRELFRLFNARRLEKGDAASTYLAARLVPSSRQRKAFERVLDIDPEYPWGHLGMAVVLRYEDHVEHRAAVERHRGTFHDTCPSRFEDVLGLSLVLRDPDFWRPRLATLRRHVEAAAPDVHWVQLQRLWDLDFLATPPDGHAAVRERIRRDLARIEAAERRDDLSWWRFRLAALERLAEPERRDEVSAEAAAAFPCSGIAEDELRRQARAMLGEPGREAEASDEQRAAFERLLRGLLDRCPENFDYNASLFGLVALRDDVPAEERLALTERYIEVWEAHRDRIRMFHSPYYRAAEELLRRGLAAERAAELARQEIDLVGEELAPPAAGVDAKGDAEPSERDLEELRGRAIKRADNRALLAEALLAQGRLDGAAESLAAADSFLAVHAADELEADEARVFEERRRRLARLAARLAEARDRPLDAVAHHLAAAAGAEAEEAAESRAAARRLWQELGGTEEGFGVLAAAGGGTPEVATGSWKIRDEPLPDFALTDLAGRTRRLTDFAGKTLLVNLWATWCAPCRMELPYVEELHRRLADRRDLALITLNTDYELGKVAPFLEEEGFTFPVLLAADYIQETQGGFRLPQTWIVDHGGRLRRLQEGFAPQLGDTWVEDTLAALEKVANEAPAADAETAGGGPAGEER